MHGRVHGEPPYKRVVVHGGPGAPGSALGLAVGAAPCSEPFQSAGTLNGQIEELAEDIRAAEPPVVLVGHSWGAMLSMLTAARHPTLVSKVILVGSGGFSKESYAKTHETRMSRLNDLDRARTEEIRAEMKARPAEQMPELVDEYYRVISKADAYDPDPDAPDGTVEFQNDINKSVWSEVAALRESGVLLARVLRVQCQVVAIHGEHDPHPADDIEQPLSGLRTFRMVRISKCGHEAWKERQARIEFWDTLRKEL